MSALQWELREQKGDVVKAAIGKTVIKAGWKALETKINAALKNKDSDENEKKRSFAP